jgi:D-3-phosphoglycerate dehydrogenase
VTEFKTYIFDFDSTLVRCESLDELARIALTGNADRAKVMTRLEAITNQGMAGTLAFDESLRQRLELFQANRTHVTQTIEFLLGEITPSILRHRAWFTHHRDQIYIISGGFEDYITPIAVRLGLRADHVCANRFLYDTAGNIAGCDASLHLSKAGGKVAQVAALELPRPAVIIGDGYTDYEVRAQGEADEFWAFTENVHRPNIAAKADKIITNFADLQNLLLLPIAA